MEDTYNLQRFLAAQAQVYSQVQQELRSGRKDSHWMWFIFPQFTGLGSSAMAAKYAIRSIEEARAYLQHSILGSRIRECSQLLLQIDGHSIEEIMGYPDDLKLRSSMTLFSRATSQNEVFLQVLARFFQGQPDPNTLKQLPASAK